MEKQELDEMKLFADKIRGKANEGHRRHDSLARGLMLGVADIIEAFAEAIEERKPE